MPLYEYECDACGQRFEIIQKFSDPPADTCRSCGRGPVRRLLSSPAIQFKGSGWYITDYSQKGKSGGESGDKPAKDGKDAKKEATTTTSEKKSDTSSTSSAPSSSPKS